MALQACHKCGIGFDMDHVPAKPFKNCPNPACASPLDKEAADHVFVEASNPSQTNDAQRAHGRSELYKTVARHHELRDKA